VKISVVVPAYETAAYVAGCMSSVLDQLSGGLDVELIVIDDASGDDTLQVARAAAEGRDEVRVLSLPRNGGPGAARNAGLDAATGDWVLFLDSDDRLAPDALATLAAQLDTDADVVAFNWAFDPEDAASLDRRGGRRDAARLTAGREPLLRDYLALRTDGSVIFSAVRRSLIEENSLRFAEGLHEDVDFQFKVYACARKVDYVDAPLYWKRARADSIVETVSSRHIDGFFRAFKEMAAFIKAQEPETWPALAPHHARGLIGVVATRAREIHRRCASPHEAGDLYAHLHARAVEAGVTLPDSARPTVYEQIASHLFAVMDDAALDARGRAVAMAAFMDDIASKSWSCFDLHHSAFLRHDEVRTCCKRFFVGGEMRGDVVLLDAKAEPGRAFIHGRLVEAKRALHGAINAGEPSPCDGCPFLEFKAWPALEPLDIRYLSMEHHSVCNLKCSYCSETYYGGETAKYDVGGFLDELTTHGALDRCDGVVWGGGEPTADPGFGDMVTRLAEAFPGVKQRVLTNAVAFSPVVADLLAKDRVTVTTSVDAGSDEVFARLRGKPRRERVLKNLRAYAEANEAGVTVKYIFTEGNESLEEVRGFVDSAVEHGLLGCTFQISCDFKRDDVPEEAVVSIAALSGMLNAAGCRLVYLDDLLRQRLDELDEGARAGLIGALAAIGMRTAIADPSAFDAVAIWGAGWQASRLLDRTAFFRDVEAAFLVDSTPGGAGKRRFGREVHPPQALLDSDLPIVIAAAQATPAIYAQFLDLGVDRSRLVRSLIL
jgi:sulfatase maturation enzyme AslB (radical SAM superfamily)